MFRAGDEFRPQDFVQNGLRCERFRVDQRQRHNLSTEQAICHEAPDAEFDRRVDLLVHEQKYDDEQAEQNDLALCDQQCLRSLPTEHDHRSGKHGDCESTAETDKQIDSQKRNRDCSQRNLSARRSECDREYRREPEQNMPATDTVHDVRLTRIEQQISGGHERDRERHCRDHQRALCRQVHWNTQSRVLQPLKKLFALPVSWRMFPRLKKCK